METTLLFAVHQQDMISARTVNLAWRGFVGAAVPSKTPPGSPVVPGTTPPQTTVGQRYRPIQGEGSSSIGKPVQ